MTSDSKAERTGRLGTLRLGDLGWVLTRPGRQRRALRARRLGRGAWLLDRGDRRVRRIGSAEAMTHLVYRTSASRAHMGEVQRAMAGFLATEQLAWVLRETGVNCVLDVGANTGQFGERLRASGYRGRIVSFEPVSEFADQLEATAAHDPDWHVHRIALGDADGSAEINVTPGRLSSLRAPSDFGRRWSGKLRQVSTETIAIRRLDSVWEDTVSGIEAPRVFLKMDTQGFDLQAFRGAGERVKDVVGLQSEVAFLAIYQDMPRFPEQLAEYEAAGFEVSGVYPVSRHAATLRLIECDLIMVRSDAVDGARP